METGEEVDKVVSVVVNDVLVVESRIETYLFFIFDLGGMFTFYVLNLFLYSSKWIITRNLISPLSSWKPMTN